MSTDASNPDLELVRRFVADGGGARPVTTSPLLSALGAELVWFDPERRELTMRFSPDDLFRQGAGFIQGGAITAMLDFAMAFAGMAVSEPGKSITTANMTTSFYAPAAGRSYVATGRIDRQGRRIMFAAADLSSDERVVAAATSSLLVI